MMPLEPSTGEPRHRKSHAALSAMAMADDQLWLLTAKEIPANGGLYFNGKETAYCLLGAAQYTQLPAAVAA